MSGGVQQRVHGPREGDGQDVPDAGPPDGRGGGAALLAGAQALRAEHGRAQDAGLLRRARVAGGGGGATERAPEGLQPALLRVRRQVQRTPPGRRAPREPREGVRGEVLETARGRRAEHVGVQGEALTVQGRGEAAGLGAGQHEGVPRLEVRHHGEAHGGAHGQGEQEETRGRRLRFKPKTSHGRRDQQNVNCVWGECTLRVMIPRRRVITPGRL